MTTNNALWKQFNFFSSSFSPQTQNQQKLNFKKIQVYKMNCPDYSNSAEFTTEQTGSQPKQQ